MPNLKSQKLIIDSKNSNIDTPSRPSFKPHGNRRKAFTHSHIPNIEHVDTHKLVTKLGSVKKVELLTIFLESPENFRSNNIKLGSELQSLFKNNILFLIDYYGISGNDLFRQIKANGIKGSYQAFLNGNRTKHYNLKYLAMFSRIFHIDAWILVGVNFRQIWMKYLENEQ